VRHHAGVLGPWTRLHAIGWPLYDKSFGDVLFAAAAYLTLAMLLFRRSPTLITRLAVVLCLAVEAFQATGIPARHEHLWPVRWLLGTTFA
jgi:hypothetical protein